MTTKCSRRTFLKQTSALGVLSSGMLLGGCDWWSLSTTSEKDPSPKNSKPEIVKLTYDDSQAFYEKFEQAIENGQKVRVLFDGPHKLTEESKLFHYIANQKKEDYASFVQSIRKNDTEEGRRKLAKVFDKNLLEHQELSSPLETPSGEVVEPGTIIMIVVIVLSTVVLTEVVRGRRIKAVYLPFGAGIEFEPLTA